MNIRITVLDRFRNLSPSRLNGLLGEAGYNTFFWIKRYLSYSEYGDPNYDFYTDQTYRFYREFDDDEYLREENRWNFDPNMNMHHQRYRFDESYAWERQQAEFERHYEDYYFTEQQRNYMIQ